MDAIYLSQARYLIIEDCDVEGFTSIGLGFQSQSAANVTVTNTRIIGGQLGVRTFQSNGLVPYDVISIRNVVVIRSLRFHNLSLRSLSTLARAMGCCAAQGDACIHPRSTTCNGPLRGLSAARARYSVAAF